MSFDLNNVINDISNVLNSLDVQEILIGVIVTLLAALIVYLISYFRNSSFRLFSLLRLRVEQDTGLKHYRKTIDEELLKIFHPWMKEEQTVEEILVSVNLNIAGSDTREELEAYLHRVFQEKPTPRILITGRPGSGKSVAMRMITKMVWTAKDDTTFVPVLLTFSDIKEIGSIKELEKKIVQQLEYYQFEEGERNNLTADTFISENLTSGKIVLLFDGYDELDKSARENAAKTLNIFLGTHRNIPVIISSRTALYEKELVFEKLNLDRIEMAPFTPLGIARFISKWNFEGNKSSHELFELINGKAHLSELASNPLMLTIITFLYSLPKYTLPDNRVDFYDQCTRALLEEWDRARDTLRANKFESHQKIAILNRVAFEHITEAATTDELIHESRIHTVSRKEMERLGLRVPEYSAMKDEIVLNSGLLHAVPPRDYRFPHRTFMEFFAANYIVTENTSREILELYKQDSERWRQTLLLYMGLNRNKAYSRHILNYLKKDFINSLKANKLPSAIVFSALTECAVPDPRVANELLTLASYFLANQAPTSELIEELGFIAANPRWGHSQKARNILLNLLKRNLPDEFFGNILLALLRSRNENTDKLVVNNLRRLNLAKIVSTLSSESKFFVNQVFSIDLSYKEKSDIIEGLKEADNQTALVSLLIENADKDIKILSAYALFRMSGLPNFLDSLDHIEIGLLESNLGKLIDQKLNEWGWRWAIPSTDRGKKVAMLICDLSADWIITNRKIFQFRKTDLKGANNLFRYLTTGFLVEKGVLFHDLNLIDIKHFELTKNTLKKHWKNPINLNNLWYKLWNSEIGNRVVTPLFIAIVVGFPLLLLFLGMAGLVFFLLGWTENIFYTSLFDNFTISLIFIIHIVSGIIIFAMLLITSNQDEWLGAIIMGHPGIVFYVTEYLDLSAKQIALLSFGYYFICFFLPFHHIGYNILYLLSSILATSWVYDQKQFNITLISTKSIRKFYKKIDK